MVQSTESGKSSITLNKGDFLWSFTASLIVLIISIIFGNVFGSFTKANSNANFVNAVENFNGWWIYPVLFYGIFIILIWRAKRTLDKKFYGGKLTKSEINKIIDKWSGVVDGIGTALPLIGAAVILFTVGLGQQSQDLFLEIAIPFEIKSLFILAIAKLFESAFDDLEIQYLRHAPEEMGTVTDTELAKDMKFELVNLPDNTDLNEIKTILINWNQTIDKMKDPEFKKSLETINKIIGR
ncbi:MAG: hypothetical protein SGI89_00095 [bacterium]|nr:hypothetical protein [bacterium]